jgi:hypothetical protein
VRAELTAGFVVTQFIAGVAYGRKPGS